MNCWTKTSRRLIRAVLCADRGEEDIMDRLERAFLGCQKLQEHMRFLLNKGGLYKVYNQNLLYHGCVPLNPDGSLKSVRILWEGI